MRRPARGDSRAAALVAAIGCGLALAGVARAEEPGTDTGNPRAVAPSAEVRRIRDAYEAARPGAEELALYRLDWVPTLSEAKKRATRERRPVFVLMVENEHGGFYSGHC